MIKYHRLKKLLLISVVFRLLKTPWLLPPYICADPTTRGFLITLLVRGGGIWRKEEEKAKETAEELGCEWSTSLEDVLARDDIDAVGVFTPSGTHCEYAIQAFKAGKHAFTTKPMDIRVEQCDAAIQAAEEAGVILAVDFGYRYERFNHQVKAAIDTGMLGKVFLGDVRLKWHRKQSYYDGGFPEGW